MLLNISVILNFIRNLVSEMLHLSILFIERETFISLLSFPKTLSFCSVRSCRKYFIHLCMYFFVVCYFYSVFSLLNIYFTLLNFSLYPSAYLSDFPLANDYFHISSCLSLSIYYTLSSNLVNVNVLPPLFLSLYLSHSLILIDIPPFQSSLKLYLSSLIHYSIYMSLTLFYLC